VRLAKLVVAATCCVAATLAVQPAPALADSTRDKQWFVRSLNLAQAHRYSQGEGVTVAVIDTGVEANHPDLRGNVLTGTETTPGSRGGNGQRDTIGHGTKMAGLIAAHGNGSGDGALGIAPKAKILPIRDSDPYGFGSDAGEVAGIDWAIAHGAKVISISRGGSTTPTLEGAVNRARAADVVVVNAVGNRPEAAFVAAAAALPGVVAVAATDRNDNHAAVSVTGPEVMIAAPGVDITSVSKGGGYTTGTGTSDSTAIVSGAAALVRAKYPDLSADEVIHRLTATATDKGPPGRDEEYGFGVLNIVAALTANVPPAGQVNATASATPSRSPSRTAAAAPAPGPDSSSDSSTAVLALVVLAALVVAGILAWLYTRRRHRTS
jgi:type VII secretion-associated serine protease mycosin